MKGRACHAHPGPRRAPSESPPVNSYYLPGCYGGPPGSWRNRPTRAAGIGPRAGTSFPVLRSCILRPPFRAQWANRRFSSRLKCRIYGLRVRKGFVVAHLGAIVLKLRNVLVVASQDRDTFSHSSPSSAANILTIVNPRVF